MVFFRVWLLFKNIFCPFIEENKHCFLCCQNANYYLDLIWRSFFVFRHQKMVIFTIWGEAHKLLLVVLIKLNNFYFRCSLQFRLSNLGLFSTFRALMGYFGGRVLKCFWFYSCSWTTFIFLVFSKSDFDVELILGIFFTFWALMNFFGGRGKVKKMFWGLLM